MSAAEKTVGVIGGMGPAATVEFMNRLIAAVPARDDCDHLHVIVDNNPKIPSRLAVLVEGEGEDPAPVLIAMARGLETAGADFLTIPCNTAHYYRPQIAGAVGIPVLDVIAHSAARLAAIAPRVGRVGILGSPALRRMGLFDEALRARDIELLHPAEDVENTLLDIIRAVKAGALTDTHRKTYIAAAATLVDRGAKALLVACTELSLLPAPAKMVTIDTLDVLVEETVRAARSS